MILKNTSDKDIVNYRIAEAQKDADGNIVRDNQGKYVETDRTLEWSIKAGETLEFPDYVGNYLMGIYGFLKQIDDDKPKKKKKKSAKPETGSVRCKECGLYFKNEKALALHWAHNHPEKLTQ